MRGYELLTENSGAFAVRCKKDKSRKHAGVSNAGHALAVRCGIDVMADNKT